jgi:hypothetical protein
MILAHQELIALLELSTGLAGSFEVELRGRTAEVLEGTVEAGYCPQIIREFLRRGKTERPWQTSKVSDAGGKKEDEECP